MILGLTGTIGSGKSTVGKMLSALMNADLLDTDQICRELLLPEQAGWLEMRKSWPARFFTESGDIDRVFLREAIFADEKVRATLEEILHPLVFKSLQSAIDTVSSSRGMLLVEVPLLFEKGWQDNFEQIISVYVDQSLCEKRVLQRDNVSLAQVRRILSLQKSPEEKAELADSIIDNSQTLSQTFVQVSQLSRKLINQQYQQNVH